MLVVSERLEYANTRGFFFLQKGVSVLWDNLMFSL